MLPRVSVFEPCHLDKKEREAPRELPVLFV